MLTELKIENFKSWRDTGKIRLAPLTGFFGTNSSGKTSLLQFLLMLKQTTESSDRQRVLHTGDDRSPVDLGTFYDIAHNHELPQSLRFNLEWKIQPKPLAIIDPEGLKNLFKIDRLNYQATITGDNEVVTVDQFAYSFNNYRFGMRKLVDSNKYEIIDSGYDLKRTRGRPWELPTPLKSYGFPDQVNAYYQNASFLSEITLAFEELFKNIYYLGPLREDPSRYYAWSGQRPEDVGKRGELAISALLASRRDGRVIKRGKGKRRQSVEERVANWLADLGLLRQFKLQPIAKNRKDYEVRVQQTARSAEVLITDVGFGVSQVLPVLVLCYYAPEYSTIILEQPEIHLHPAVQAGLADVFIDAIKTRKVQIIIESHSEHLLRRLQRRIAEEEIKSIDTALYFSQVKASRSHLTPLQVDIFGNIQNWPENFFGDEMGDLAAMAEAMLKRRVNGQ